MYIIFCTYSCCFFGVRKTWHVVWPVCGAWRTFWRESAPDFWRGILFRSNLVGCVLDKSVLRSFVWVSTIRAFFSLCALPCVDNGGYLTNGVLLFVSCSLEIKMGQDRYRYRQAILLFVLPCCVDSEGVYISNDEAPLHYSVPRSHAIIMGEGQSETRWRASTLTQHS